MNPKTLEPMIRAAAAFDRLDYDAAERFLNEYRASEPLADLKTTDFRTGPAPHLSVVLTPGFGADPLAPAMLGQFESQSLQSFELIILDRSDSPLPSEPRGVSALVIHPPKELPKAEGLNIAAGLARGEILVFTAWNAALDPDYLETIARNFDDYDISGLRGRIPPLTDSAMNFRDNGRDPGRVMTASPLDTIENMAVDKAKFLAAHGFHPLLETCCGLELSYKLVKANGTNLAYAPDCVIRADLNLSEGEFEARERRAAQERAFLSSAYPGFDQCVDKLFFLRADPKQSLYSGLSIPAKDTKDRLGVRDLELALMLHSREKHAVLAARFGQTRQAVFSSLVSSALIKAKDFDAAESYLKSLPPSDENKLKLKSIPLLREMEAPLEDRSLVHILVLAHNRRDYAANALAQIAGTDYDNYALFMADNGSTDGTWSELERAARFFPETVPVSLERFPTNIGRPIGHNWLLEKYDHSQAEYIVIADDDLFLVPPDWLSRMIKTIRLFPDAAVVGGKAFDDSSPRLIHGSVRRITCYEHDDFAMTFGPEEIDYGQFDYIDRVDHVIGCLHIYRRDLLFDRIGLFDISLSPCQMVDVEHHLRTRLLGFEIIYNGLIDIGHMRQMGRKSQATRAGLGNVLGNQVKMLHKHDADQVRPFLREQRKLYQRRLDE